MTEMTSPSTTSGEPFTVQHDRLGGQPLSVTIAQAVADYDGTDVTALEPLHHAINADALERLFEPRADGLRSGGRVSFEYADYLVTVEASGRVTVEPIDS